MYNIFIIKNGVFVYLRLTMKLILIFNKFEIRLKYVCICKFFLMVYIFCRVSTLYDYYEATNKIINVFSDTISVLLFRRGIVLTIFGVLRPHYFSNFSTLLRKLGTYTPM